MQSLHHLRGLPSSPRCISAAAPPLPKSPGRTGHDHTAAAADGTATLPFRCRPPLPIRVPRPGQCRQTRLVQTQGAAAARRLRRQSPAGKADTRCAATIHIGSSRLPRVIGRQLSGHRGWPRSWGPDHAVDLVQEVAEVDGPVLGGQLADHLAGSDVQRGEQVHGAVPFVAEAAPFGHPGHHGQYRGGAFQGLVIWGNDLDLGCLCW